MSQTSIWSVLVLRFFSESSHDRPSSPTFPPTSWGRFIEGPGSTEASLQTRLRPSTWAFSFLVGGLDFSGILSCVRDLVSAPVLLSPLPVSVCRSMPVSIFLSSKIQGDVGSFVRDWSVVTEHDILLEIGEWRYWGLGVGRREGRRGPPVKIHNITEVMSFPT